MKRVDITKAIPSGQHPIFKIIDEHSFEKKSTLEQAKKELDSLLEGGFDIDTPYSIDGDLFRTPLYMAIRFARGEYGLARYLIEKGAEIDCIGANIEDGETIYNDCPLDSVIDFCTIPDVRKLSDDEIKVQEEMVKSAVKFFDYFLTLQPNLDPRDDNGLIATAALSENSYVIEKLLSLYDYDLQNERVAHKIFSFIDNRTELVDYFVELGVNPDVPSEEGYTPLHNAASYMSIDVMKALLYYGARGRHKSDDGYFVSDTLRIAMTDCFDYKGRYYEIAPSSYNGRHNELECLAYDREPQTSRIIEESATKAEHPYSKYYDMITYWLESRPPEEYASKEYQVDMNSSDSVERVITELSRFIADKEPFLNYSKAQNKGEYRFKPLINDISGRQVHNFFLKAIDMGLEESVAGLVRGLSELGESVVDRYCSLFGFREAVKLADKDEKYLELMKEYLNSPGDREDLSYYYRHKEELEAVKAKYGLDIL